MRRRTKIKITYSIIFLIIGFLVGQFAPSITGLANISLPSSDNEDLAEEKEMTDLPKEKEVDVKEDDTSDTLGSETIKIGAILPLTGDVAVLGQPVRQAIELALRDSGLGNVEIVFEDSKCSPKDAATVAQKLIGVDNVQAIVGPMCSSATLSIIPIIDESQVPIISPASTNPSLSGSSDFFFRTIPSDSLQGSTMADTASSLGFDRVALLYVNNDYGVGLSDVFKDSFSGEIVVDESFDQSATDFRTQLSKIKDADVDALYFVSYPAEAGQIMKQASELGLDVQLLSSEGVRDDSVLEVAKESSEGLIITVPESSSGPKFERFVSDFMSAYDSVPGLFTAEAYDATNIILFGVASGFEDKEDIQQYLSEDLGEYVGASGIISFDMNGDVSRSYSLLRVSGGMFVPFDAMEFLVDPSAPTPTDTSPLER